MKPQQYDIRLARILRALRLAQNLKQINLANCLRVDRTTYGRIEKGELCLTPGNLKLLAAYLQTHHLTILQLADEDDPKPVHF